MSQKVNRKVAVNEEKDKSQTETPVKEMKKKMAANAEKEKQTMEKNAKESDKTEKVDKVVEKDKNVDKAEKSDKADKKTDKSDKADKKVEKSEKNDKKTEKIAEKEPEKKEDNSKADKNGKADKQEKPDKKDAPKLNGNKTNGDANGDVDHVSSDDDIATDEPFPELAYDDTSDTEGFEGFERPSTDGALSRSLTRRSQSKEPKILKLTDAPSSDRKLRSADSPKPESKKDKILEESPKTAQAEKGQSEDANKKGEQTDEKAAQGTDKAPEVIVIDLDADEEGRKPDTNFSKSRVKVSPYRRSTRLADQTTSSVMANYSGNNTTMEMDITESSLASPDAAYPYLRGLRAIRGRSSYKQLGEFKLEQRRAAEPMSCDARPTGTVVGRKRRPEPEDSIELATEASDYVVHSKRMRLLDRLAMPFRRTAPATLPTRRAAEIVGINSDLPLSTPAAALPLVAPTAAPTFDPETLKTTAGEPVATPLTPPGHDAKRCVIV